MDRIKRLQEAQLSLIKLKARGETLTGQAVLKASEQYALDDSEAAALALTLCETGFLPATQEEAEAYLAGLGPLDGEQHLRGGGLPLVLAAL